MSGIAGRIAGAPISWGVCEVPGWGHQLSPERVLAEIAKIRLEHEARASNPQPVRPTWSRSFTRRHDFTVRV